jgi:hypothetical protein
MLGRERLRSAPARQRILTLSQLLEPLDESFRGEIDERQWRIDQDSVRGRLPTTGSILGRPDIENPKTRRERRERSQAPFDFPPD